MTSANPSRTLFHPLTLFTTQPQFFDVSQLRKNRMEAKEARPKNPPKGYKTWHDFKTKKRRDKQLRSWVYTDDTEARRGDNTGVPQHNVE